ncbi:MAG: GMC family oxidoreductase [Burkholderiales bacterium]|nr:GMC family oxidoreductase [Burkholderiales bacterium]
MSVMDSRKIYNGAHLDKDLGLTVDVVIVGTGAGGGFTAEVLTNAGLKVAMVEEGGYHTAKTFSQNEGEAMAMLYQESGGAQRTKDKGIVVLQGKSVGGGTTVNWTTCFKPPELTLRHWHDVHGLDQMTPEVMTPYIDKVFARLNVHKWTEQPLKMNNQLLADGCKKLGYRWDTIWRNVKGCADSGLCGNGCPINAKQSQLVTTIPAALDNGAIIVTRARVVQIVHDGKRASGVEAVALDDTGVHPTGKTISIKAKHVVLSAGGIRSPALLMRSKAPDPSGKIGKRTFLHPVVFVWGRFEQMVNSFYGAPQSVYSDQFLFRDNAAANGKLGFIVEANPLSPIFAGVLGDKAIGADHASLMTNLPRMHCTNALCRDGFNDFEIGGTVHWLDDHPVLDYPTTDWLIKEQRFAIDKIMEIMFAAGAQAIYPWHIDMPGLKTYREARAWAYESDHAPQRLSRGSAHVMGGCAMGKSDKDGVVNQDGRLYGLENVSVHDASIFPTSIGLNPQVSIYTTTLRNVTKLAAELTKS